MSTSSPSPVLDRLKSEAGLQYIAEIPGDRHLFTAPIDRVQSHPRFSTALRANDPKDRKLLEVSQKTTSGPIYTPCVYIDEDLQIFLVDGHQRLAAAKANGDDQITVQWISRWTDEATAMRDAVDLQYGRYEMSEADVAALIKDGMLTKVDIARHTGYEESKVVRLAKIVEHDWMWNLYQEKCIGLGPAGKLIDACGRNHKKLRALSESLTQRYEHVEKEAKRVAAEIAANPSAKHSRQKKKRAKIESYFKNYDWSTIADDLEDADDESVQVDLNRSPSKLAVEVGETEDEWTQEIAVRQFFGRNPKDLSRDDIDIVLDRWDYIRTNLERIRNGEKPVSYQTRSRPLSDPPAPEPQTIQADFDGEDS